MVGEVTTTTAIIQTRLTQGKELVDGEAFDDGDALRDGDLSGVQGRVRFGYRAHNTKDLKWSSWVAATQENDFIARTELSGLSPNTLYMTFVEFEGNPVGQFVPLASAFITLAGKDIATETRFHVVTGMNYDKFYGSDGGKPYQGEDRDKGFPAYEAMQSLNPSFVVYTGDDVYYDKKPQVKTLADMRAKWHRQFSRWRFIKLNKTTPGYWMKDDHDHRTNDSDATGDYFPSHELGLKTFREQVPIYADTADKRPTYRTYRVSKDLQIWLPENRDYRDPNKMEDGPEKTMWGKEQLAWMKKTLVESDATYKVIVSATPTVGPDDSYKRDNHTNFNGFRHEGDAFKNWAKEQGLWESGLYLACGDRHWQYHSIDSTGAHEFSCGAICDANSRLGRKPGDKKSTDPEAQITQPYYQKPASGGFLSVVVEPGEGEAKAAIKFEFYDENGELLYNYKPDKK